MNMWESVKEIQYYCGRLDFRHVVDKHMVHFFGNINFIRKTMLLYNGALVILKEVISLNVCAMNTVLLYMIICYLVVCVISFDYSSNSLYFSPSLSMSL